MVSASSFLLLLVAVIILIVVPSISEIRLINIQVNEERERLEKLYIKGQIRKQVQSNFENIKEDAKFLENIILKESHELEYITAVENAAEKNGISITMSTGEAKIKPEQDFSELEFTFSTTGDWEDILRWIGDIESLPYYTNISEISVTAREEGKETKLRTANALIKAKTYWLKP